MKHMVGYSYKTNQPEHLVEWSLCPSFKAQRAQMTVWQSRVNGNGIFMKRTTTHDLNMASSHLFNKIGGTCV